MDKETYMQLDRMEAKIDFLITKLLPEEIKDKKEE
jgi:hypothetical protein